MSQVQFTHRSRTRGSLESVVVKSNVRKCISALVSPKDTPTMPRQKKLKTKIKFKLPSNSKDKLETVPFLKWIVVFVIVDIVLTTLILIFKEKIPPQIPLYYGAPRGKGQLAQNISLVIPSIFSTVVIIINSALAYILRNTFLKQVLVFGALLVNLLTIITTIKILALVGNF